MRKSIDVEQEYYCACCDFFEPDVVKLYADGRVIVQYLVCRYAEKCRFLHGHIQNRMNFELDKAKRLEAENERLKTIIRSNEELCRSCKGHDEKSPNYGYTEFCENCFWYPWADEEKCPNKWELKE